MPTTVSLANSANILKRHHGADSPEYLNAKRDWAAQRLEDHIRNTLADAPPLTEEQARRLSGLLRGGVK